MSIMIINNGKLQNLTNHAQLTGDKIPGDLDTWNYFGTDPNEILKLSYDILCQRATTLYHTHPPVTAAINKQTAYAIGNGLVYRSQPDWQTLGITKEKAKDWGMRFQKLVHYAFLMLNYYEKQATLFCTSLIMGDSVLLFDRETPDENMPFDLIEIGGDQINFQATPEGTELITLGIIHDKFLRRKGFVLNDIQQSHIYFKDANGDQNAIQFYDKKMARQLRGMPLSYRIIAAAKNNDRWWDAMLARAVMESTMLGFSKSDQTDTREQALRIAQEARGIDGISANPASGLSTLTNTANMPTGSIMQLDSKGDFQFVDFKTPSNNFDKLQTAYIECVGMATDTPPEVVMSKYSTSFTAHKGALNDFIKFYTQKRFNFIRNVNKPVIREIAKWLFMENLIEMPNPLFFKDPIIQEATLAGIWLGPVPGHINPAQEVGALVTAKDNAFITPADAAAQYGSREWDDQIEEWQQQMEEFQKMSPEKQAQALQQDIEKKTTSEIDIDYEQEIGK